MSDRRRRHRRLPSGAALLLMALMSPWSASASRDRDVFRHPEAVALVSLPPILEDESVREQLDSGLTTTFWFELSARDARGNRVASEGWLALRYELWDEIFVAESGGFLGQRRFRLESFEALDDYWRQPTAARLDARELASDDRWRVVLDIEVIPFSAGEQEDARQWMAKTLRESESGSPEDVSAPSARDGAFGSVLRLLLATSIRPDPLFSVREKYRLDPLPVSKKGAP